MFSFVSFNQGRLCRSYIQAVIKPEVLSPDMKDASQPETWRLVDLYGCGFPCQPWSSAGKQEGSDDKDRGRFFKDIFRRITIGKPRAYLLENVPGLAQGFPEKFNIMIDILRKVNSAAYNVMWEEMETDRHGGLPQNRKRLFIVGILREAQVLPFRFPDPLSGCLTLTQLLGPPKAGPLPDLASKTMDDQGRRLSKTVQDNLKCFAQKTAGQDLKSADYIIDTGSSKCNFMPGRCPCLTLSRCSGQHGYFSVSRDRFLNVRDFLLLQGYPKSLHQEMLQAVDERTLKSMLGNAMSLPVVTRIVRQIFISQGLVSPR